VEITNLVFCDQQLGEVSSEPAAILIQISSVTSAMTSLNYWVMLLGMKMLTVHIAAVTMIHLIQ